MCSNPSLLPQPRQRKSVRESYDRVSFFCSLDVAVIFITFFELHISILQIAIIQIDLLTSKDYISVLMELAQDRRVQRNEIFS